MAGRSTKTGQKNGKKASTATDEGAVLLLTLTSHKALEDFFFLLLLQVSEKSEEFKICPTEV